MPFSDMPVDELIVRSLPLAFLLLSGLFCGVSALLGRARRRRGLSAPGVYPGSREQAGDLNLGWWRSLSAAEQEAADNAVLAANEDAGEAVRRAVDVQVEAAIADAVKRNALFHP